MNTVVKSYVEKVITSEKKVVKRKVVESFEYDANFEKKMNDVLLGEEEFFEQYLTQIFYDIITCSEEGEAIFPKKILKENAGELFVGDWIASCDGLSDYLTEYIKSYMYKGECYYEVPESLSPDTVFAEAIKLAKTSSKASKEEIEMLDRLAKTHKESVIKDNPKVVDRPPYKKKSGNVIIINPVDTYNEWLKDALEIRVNNMDEKNDIDLDDLLEYTINNSGFWNEVDQSIIQVVDEYVEEKLK